MWQRRFAMSGYDLVSELYESEQMRRANLVCGHFGSVPEEPGHGQPGILLVTQQLSGRVIPKGGSGTLAVALGKLSWTERRGPDKQAGDAPGDRE